MQNSESNNNDCRLLLAVQKGNLCIFNNNIGTGRETGGGRRAGGKGNWGRNRNKDMETTTTTTTS